MLAGGISLLKKVQFRLIAGAFRRRREKYPVCWHGVKIKEHILLRFWRA
jgi:hypothetical protein